ncbi:recombinase family protein [Brucella anthropi]|uniref:recombinase family protein n=1 Tax=Brucella/Ochrobactrum group TaxID=2826938 RepID=UPI00124DE114|nr:MULTISPECIES: recombinase family protein [Brucella/Ochrobactrum group]KAB2759537.1 recombinase family protein [Brucella anthropi]KAB2775336.1 recombinase family protein [Brucella anthropi]MCQ9146902.1 recombinase family protein [Ochrobactrum sp. BTU2]UGQ20865.1 recombinase family protein [Brucella anthropi]
MRNFGYARVSTTEQNLDLQLSALRAVGCHDVLTDEGISGSEFSRPGLSKLLKRLRAGDTLIVWRLDRLGRSLFNLIKLVRELEERGIQFRSMSESIDTGTSGGRLLFHLLAAMAEFERSLVSERTRAGMAAARARGSRIGRRPAMSPEQIAEATSAFVDHGLSLVDIARQYSIHPRTLKSKMRLTTSDRGGS